MLELTIGIAIIIVIIVGLIWFSRKAKEPFVVLDPVNPTDSYQELQPPVTDNQDNWYQEMGFADFKIPDLCDIPPHQTLDHQYQPEATSVLDHSKKPVITLKHLLQPPAHQRKFPAIGRCPILSSEPPVPLNSPYQQDRLLTSLRPQLSRPHYVARAKVKEHCP